MPRASSSMPSVLLAVGIARGRRRAIFAFAVMNPGLATKGHSLVGAERLELAERHAHLFFGAIRHERLRLLRGVVLEQRVPFELGVHQDAAQIGMTAERDAAHVERLALEP